MDCFLWLRGAGRSLVQSACLQISKTESKVHRKIRINKVDKSAGGELSEDWNENMSPLVSLGSGRTFVGDILRSSSGQVRSI